MFIVRIAVVDPEKCNPEKCNSECINVCPINRKGEDCVYLNEEKKRALIDEDLCIGCGICIKKCPFGAIAVLNTPEKLEETPIHRFGENEFVLFRLPVPKKGVVGLLGSNGIGKSTSLKILSGKIKPNLGKKETDWEEIITVHRGTELQDYFEELKDEKIKTAYKPQQISLIPKVETGTLKRKLKNVRKELIKDLELENCLDRKMDELSGGELQRAAIAATITKDADLYLFDEPTSYLDVRQRLNVAKRIRKLAENKRVIVVEHDLATLDFLADRIHVFYGRPSVFGVASPPYSTKQGINAFLDGYIKADNVRFRKKTKFEEIERRTQKINPIVSFENLKKEYENFTLKIDKGKIYEEEVLGIFGMNALGKTTFAKMLAGEIDYKGKIDHNLKIAYKPQYLQSDFEGTVRQLLSSVKGMFSKDNKINILEPLNMNRIMGRNVKDLSGGELQKVAIALCLSKDADLYLLDEPSAYLDVDQRLQVAKMIRSKKGSVVIDHDLLFLSYVADRAMLFKGEGGKYGEAKTMSVKKGFNTFLKDLGITFRKEKTTKRPRANKLDSVKDREQKNKGEYFYTG